MNQKMLLGLAVLTGALASCGDDELAAPETGSPLPPRISAAQVTPNPHSSLSALVGFTAEQADSARVVYLADGAAVESSSYRRVSGGTDTIAILGLRPSTAYRTVLEVTGPGGTVRSDTLAFTAGPLPDPLQRLTIATRGTGGSGLNLTSLQLGGGTVFALVFDSVGVIRWYRQFVGTEPYGGEIKQQTNGHFTLYRGSSTGIEPTPGHFVEFTAAGDSLRSVAVLPPRYLDNHDLLITQGPDGQDRFHYFTYDRRISDLTSVGGGAAVSLAGHQLVRQRADETIELEWNAWDHLSFAEWIEPPKPAPSDSTGRDFDHPNSLHIDAAGDYIVSFRSLGQVMKLDGESGAMLWRLGGARNQFVFQNDPLGGFSAQHSARMLPDGNLLLYDNGTRHQPPESRAVEYALDTTAMTATLVWQFRHQPPIYTSSLGLVQRLRSGNTLIGYGLIGRTVEVDPAGAVLWEAELRLEGQPALVYRVLRIATLYRYVEP